MLIGLFIYALLGLVVGSFVNAYVWRLHMQETRGKNREPHLRRNLKPHPESPRYSITMGRSMCPDCGHELRFGDLVPVLSWLWLRGKCRYCGRYISWQYPVVEIVMATLFAVSWLWWLPLEATWGGALLGIWLAISALFVALAVYDIRWFTLPAPMLRLLLGSVVAFHGLQALSGAPLSQWLIGPLLGAVGAFAAFYLLHIIGRGQWMGGGDVKLVFVLGLLVGGIDTIVGLFLGFVMGAVVGIALLLLQRKGRRDLIPFGPFLLLGFWVAFFWGEELRLWYEGFVLGLG